MTLTNAADARPAAQPPAAADDEISLAELFGQLWRGKWLITACVMLTVGLGLGYLAMSQPTYRVSYVVAPVGGGGDSGGLPSGARQAAEFAGVSLPSEKGGVPRILKYANALTSLTVADRLAERHDMLRKVFHEKWDPEAQAWNLEPGGGPVAWVSNNLNDLAGIPTAPRAPDARDLKGYLEENLSVQSGEETSLYTVSVEHPRPEVAQLLLRRLNEVTDELLRERALQRTQRYVDYVQAKLPETTLSAHRDSLTRLLVQQERQLMMAKIDGPYAAEVFDPITVSSGPVSPNVKAVLAASILLGLMGGGFLVFLWGALRRDRPEDGGQPATAGQPGSRAN